MDKASDNRSCGEGSGIEAGALMGSRLLTRRAGPPKQAGGPRCSGVPELVRFHWVNSAGAARRELSSSLNSCSVLQINFFSEPGLSFT